MYGKLHSEYSERTPDYVALRLFRDAFAALGDADVVAPRTLRRRPG